MAKERTPPIKPTLTFVRAANPRWGDADHTYILVDVEFAELSALGLHGFCASPSDPELHGREIFQSAALEKFGKVAEFVAPPPRQGDQMPDAAATAPVKKRKSPARKPKKTKS